MDRLIYVSMTGARHALEAQASVAHNLANATSSGFRAQLNALRAVHLFGEGLPTRAYVVDSTVGTDFRPGTVQQTGRALDVAIMGRGFLAVQLPDGSEAYTRAGGLSVGAGGVLQSPQGHPVLGDGGPIAIPPDVTVTIAKDGTVSAIPTSGRSAVNVLGRLKLVNPPEADLVRGEEGMFRLKGGAAAPAENSVVVAAAAIEGSNVNPVEQLIALISHARAFETHMKMLQSADQNDRQANQLLSLNR
ncbi:MAG: flagellar basal body rod protein FlgF [Burkholderiales bacterium]|nr:flagellar basal body rod protein FlgF [Burkholderiales bacterium]